MADSMRAIGRDCRITSVTVTGSASPDGDESLNQRLAAERAGAVSRYLVSSVPLDSGSVTVRSLGENWPMLRERLAEEPGRYAGEMRVIDSDTCPRKREAGLRYLDGGARWGVLTGEVFPLMRTVTVEVASEPLATDATGGVVTEVVMKDTLQAATGETAVVEETVSVVETTTAFAKHWYLKTNAPAWALLWMNIAAERDIAPHWSVTLPVYYSGFNYFTGRTKFRTFTLLPEARYWLRDDNTGWFVGLHTGFSFYNVAFGGDHRYQDHKRSVPAYGGGFAAGFRTALGSSGRWWMEASLGAGVYRLDYDVFQNHHNGPVVDRRKRTFLGIDNVALSFCYRFDAKGGDR